MAIYSRNGTQLSSALAPNGVELDAAFNIDGSEVFFRNNTIKVMTYNVGTWYDGKHDNVPANQDAEYYALQKGIIQSNSPDIICMEEYCKQFSKAGRTAISILQELGYTYIHEEGGASPTAAPANGRCIASKYPITSYTVRNFGDASQLYYDSCTIFAKGKVVNVLVTHLHWDNWDLRIAEMNTIKSLVEGMTRFILCGDFNTADCKSISGRGYTDVIKPFLDDGFKDANCGEFGFINTYYDTPDSSYTGVLDHIITSGNISILGAGVDTTKLNDELVERVDHLPLIATLEI